MSYLNIAYGWLTRLDRIEEVLIVICARIDLVFLLAEHLVLERRGIRAQLSALHLHIAFSPEEMAVILSCFGLVDHLHTIGILVDKS